jgi:hypothetical protein
LGCRDCRTVKPKPSADYIFAWNDYASAEGNYMQQGTS